VHTIADQLISSGKAQHALLGITPANAVGGAKVTTVEAGTAAKDAGLQVGDVITKVDGVAVVNAAKLRAIIGAREPGDQVTLTITRNGDTKTVHVTLGTRS
jgi:putative serine protease PepD